MKSFEYLKIAGKNLLNNKLRSSLTMLGIIIGNASVIIMVGVGQGAQKVAAEQFDSLGPNLLFVLPNNQNPLQVNQRPLVLEDAEAIASQVTSVKQVAPQLRSTQLVTHHNKNISTQIIGATPAFLTVRNYEIAKGRFLTDLDLRRSDRIVVLGAEVAKQLFDNQNPINQRLRIQNASFQVVGVMQSKGAYLDSNQDTAVWVPLTTMANQIVGDISPYGGKLTAIAISVKDADSIQKAQFQITNLMRLRHKMPQEDHFRVETQKELLKTADTIAIALTAVLVAIGSISLLVGGIGIMNIMLVSVTERTPEIGLRKAVGASQQDILIQFLIEAVILSVTGGLIGIFIGINGSLLIAALTPLKASISLVATAVTIAVSGSIGLFFGVVPAQQAAKLDPIVALRSA